MARIVLIHGAFNELWGPNQLKARWLPAVRDGLWHHGIEIADADVDVCFYGDLFRLDLTTLDEESWKEARAGAAEILDSFGGEDAMSFLSQAASNAVYDRTIDMVTIMTNDPTVRDRSRARLLETIEPDTDIVVGHSLGTVVAYQALAANPGIEIDTLITLGSPLGSDMVFPTLAPAPIDGVGAWPGRTRRWVNIAAHGDHAASVSRLADKFGDRVEDHLIDNGYRVHDPEPYLNSATAGAAIARVLQDPASGPS